MEAGNWMMLDKFQSTLSMRRATFEEKVLSTYRLHFNPRSP